MEIEKLAEGIWEVRNILTQEEVDYLLLIARDSDEPFWYSDDLSPDWSGRVMNIPRTYGKNSKETEAMYKINDVIEHLFVNFTEYVSPHSMLRYLPGRSFSYHTDSVNDINNVFGLIFYLNEDFTGGELSYKDIGLDIKPKANSMLIHRADICHGVKEVTSGIRYVVTSFIEGDKTTAIRES